MGNEIIVAKHFLKYFKLSPFLQRNEENTLAIESCLFHDRYNVLL